MCNTKKTLSNGYIVECPSSIDDPTIDQIYARCKQDCSTCLFPRSACPSDTEDYEGCEFWDISMEEYSSKWNECIIDQVKQKGGKIYAP